MDKNLVVREKLDKFIPWGTSTCAKRAAFMPEEPATLVRGQGCRVWDANGKEYIDFKTGLGPVVLGYNFPAVNAAILEQMKSGYVFSYPHPLEAEVAELFCQIIPCAEKARFLKTGGEAVAACIKIARAVTNREHVIQIGYNGWLNSLAGDGMVLPGQKAQAQLPGIPAALSALHHNCGWNDVEHLEQLGSIYGSDLAAIVVAADYNHMELGATFYPALRKFADRHGALLIFDEIVTGFRIALGGVQEYFKVKPDLAVFAKAITNGMPLSVYCGKAEYMDVLLKATVSSTYGGETLSLAAAKAVINVFRTEPVIEHIWQAGEKMWGGLDQLFTQYGLPVRMGGHRPVSFYNYAADVPQDFPARLARATYAAGLTPYNGGYVGYSHKDADIAEALERYEKALKTL